MWPPLRKEGGDDVLVTLSVPVTIPKENNFKRRKDFVLVHGFGAQLDLLLWGCGQAEPPGRACGGGCSPPCSQEAE